MVKKNTVNNRMEDFIRNDGAGIFFTSDFRNLGSKSSVSKSINYWIDNNLLVRVSNGIYVRVRYNQNKNKSYLDTNFPAGGIKYVIRMCLKRMNVAWEDSEAVRLYNEGKSTQVSLNAVFVVSKNFTRKFWYKQCKIKFYRTLKNEKDKKNLI